MNTEENKRGPKAKSGKRVTMVIPDEVYSELETLASSAYRTISSQAVFQICKSFDYEDQNRAKLRSYDRRQSMEYRLSEGSH